MKWHRSRGVTLVEACVVVAVLGVILAIAIPSFSAARQRVVIEGLAAQIVTDIHYARSEAVSRAQTVRLSFGNAIDNGCYVIHTGGADDCRCTSEGRSECTADAEALKTMSLGGVDGVRLEGSVASMAFSGMRGTVSPAGTARLIGRDGQALHQVVNIMGRVRLCSPETSMRGYPPC